MRIREEKIYTYSELSESAKAKARDWYRQADAGDNFFAESVTEDFLETLTALGFDTGARDVSWSGFWSQGDGACFKGTWRASDCKPEKLLEDRPEYRDEKGLTVPCRENQELHRIAGEILAAKTAGMEYARIETRGRGFFMELYSSDYAEPESATNAEWDAIYASQKETGERFLEACRDLAHAFYKALEAGYEYVNSDEQVAESIEANGYEFTEEGEHA